MPEAVIINAVRSPIGALGGGLSTVRPDDLAAFILQALMRRSEVDVDLVEEVYLGCANQAAWPHCWPGSRWKPPG
jgi:acetyl-CoA acetyltransferase